MAANFLRWGPTESHPNFTSHGELRVRVNVPLKLPYGNSRLVWQARARLVKSMKENVKLQILSSVNELGGVPIASERRVLEMTLARVRYWMVNKNGKGVWKKQARLDPDNAVAALKPVVDSLVDLGLLRNDKEEWVDYRMPRQVDDVKEHYPYVDVKVSW